MACRSALCLPVDSDAAVLLLTCTLLFVTSGYLYHRQPWVPRRTMSTSISDEIYQYCTGPSNVTSALAEDPSQEPADLVKKLYGTERLAITKRKAHLHQPATPEELQRARECGRWGNSHPSDLFLRCYHAALCSLEYDPLAGMVSPSLMGSSGVIPATVIAPVPVVCRHMANVIVRAKKEVFLATNFWIASKAATIITDAIKELSRRAGERQERVVVKIMYDRGNIKQVIDNHQIMSPKQYTADAVKLPTPEEVPHIDMEVQNYHRPMLGTFHSKFMVVDRKIAIVQSNNIQDNDNLEMMTHLEGDIVNSIYDTALIAWSKRLDPPLPSLHHPANNEHVEAFNDPSFLALFDEHGRLRVRRDSFVREDEEKSIRDCPLPRQDDIGYSTDIAAEVERMESLLLPQDGQTRMDAVTRYLSEYLRY